jgi:hypothetical protein
MHFGQWSWNKNRKTNVKTESDSWDLINVVAVTV